ncbi:MAG: DUF368 domain-containing protein [Mariniblastus sp.]
MSQLEPTKENLSNEGSSLSDISNATLVTRSSIGGFLMGLANLVPGISGGTMLLASGIYPAFIDALATTTRLKFKFRSLLVLGIVVAAAGIGVLLFAGTIKDLVINQRWVMFSLFMGLTLGGVPIVWRLAKPASPQLIISAAIAFGLMVLLAVLQMNGVVGEGNSNYVTLLLAGLAGASAMILPGLSGSYLLLLMGQYVPILNAVDKFKDALSARDITAAMEPALSTLLPVGLGVVAGVVVVGNLLEWMMRKYRKATLGVLLGLLLGSTVGLWPFRVGVEPKEGDVIKGRAVTAETLSDIDQEDWLTEYFRPTTTQIVSSLALVAIGFGVTMGVAMIGKDKE